HPDTPTIGKRQKVGDHHTRAGGGETMHTGAGPQQAGAPRCRANTTPTARHTQPHTAMRPQLLAASTGAFPRRRAAAAYGPGSRNPGTAWVSAVRRPLRGSPTA